VREQQKRMKGWKGRRFFLVYCTMILLLSILETINTIILITIMVGAVFLCLLALPVCSCLMSMFGERGRQTQVSLHVEFKNEEKRQG
jgi:hypothetical protein